MPERIMHEAVYLVGRMDDVDCIVLHDWDWQVLVGDSIMAVFAVECYATQFIVVDA